jgi:uroporphyrinogen-III synthase
MNVEQPLKDCKVLVTRGRNQAAGLIKHIKEYGGIPVVVPLLDFRLAANTKDVMKKINQINSYDWLVLTSRNGVDFFFQLLHDISVNPKLPRIASIGNKTDEALQDHGYHSAFNPSQYVAEVFSEEFISTLKRTDRVLIAKGNRARSVIAERIRAFGAICEEIIIYETSMPIESEQPLIELIQNDELDIVTFTSSSTVDYFMDIVEMHKLFPQIQKITFACIGPVAKETAEKRGLSVDICPDVYTAEAMAEQIANYFLGKTI